MTSTQPKPASPMPWDLPAPLEELSTTDLKQHLLEMHEKRTAAEQQLNAAAQYLSTTPVGLRGGLIDAEGFPKEGLDHFAIREARNTVHCRQTDIEKITETLGEMLEALHAKVRAERADERDEDAEYYETEKQTRAIDGAVFEKEKSADLLSNNPPAALAATAAGSQTQGVPSTAAADDTTDSAEAQRVRISEAQRRLEEAQENRRAQEAALVALEAEFPRCYIQTAPFLVESVANGPCPARVAGLRADDHLLAFGPVSTGGLPALAQHVGQNVGRPIRVVIRRAVASDSNTPSSSAASPAPAAAATPASSSSPPPLRQRFELKAVTLVPQRWAGDGVLGCVLSTEVPSV